MSTTATARCRSSQLEPLLSLPDDVASSASSANCVRPTPSCWRANRASRNSATSSPTSPIPRRCWRSPISSICVDTSIAHVAGALGRPTCVLLPFQPDWRWTLDRDRSPWYPAVRLFRQPAPGDWASVIARVAAEATCHRGTSGSPPCRPTSPQAAGGTPSASRRTAGRRCAAPTATCCACRWLITDCSRERQRASGWCGSA